MGSNNLKDIPDKPESQKLQLSGKEIYCVVDIDSFEAMVWAKEFNELQGKPVLVVNAQRVIIAVSYEAKKFGISRAHDNVKSARSKCPTPPLIVFEIPGKDGKSDQTIPQKASFEIQKCVRSFVNNKFPGTVICMKSKDEIYFEFSEYLDKNLVQTSNLDLDLLPHKPKTVWIGASKDKIEERRLALASNIAEQILQKIREETGFIASAGVAASCIVAKIACGNDKPDALTIVTNSGVDDLYAQTNMKDAPYLKGKNGISIFRLWERKGHVLKSLLDFKKCVDIAEIQNELQLTDFQANQLKEVAEGFDLEPLEDKKKATLQSSWNIINQDRPCTQEILKKYIMNCCEELELKINHENYLFERIPKEIKIVLRSKISKRDSEGQPKVTVKSIDTRTLKYENPQKSGTLGSFIWTKLCEMWKEGEKTFANFEDVTEIMFTTSY